MATAQSPLARQPEQLDYASPTQFRFGIHQLPKVEFFTVSANLPGITLPAAPYPTPFKDIPIMGEKLDYANLSVINTLKEYDYNLSNINIDIISSKKLIEHIKKQ